MAYESNHANPFRRYRGIRTTAHHLGAVWLAAGITDAQFSCKLAQEQGGGHVAALPHQKPPSMPSELVPAPPHQKQHMKGEAQKNNLGEWGKKWGTGTPPTPPHPLSRRCLLAAHPPEIFSWGMRRETAFDARRLDAVNGQYGGSANDAADMHKRQGHKSKDWCEMRWSHNGKQRLFGGVCQIKAEKSWKHHQYGKSIPKAPTNIPLSQLGANPLCSTNAEISTKQGALHQNKVRLSNETLLRTPYKPLGTSTRDMRLHTDYRDPVARRLLCPVELYLVLGSLGRYQSLSHGACPGSPTVRRRPLAASLWGPPASGVGVALTPSLSP